MARAIPTVCFTCGSLFLAKSLQAAYCSDACRRRAGYYRRSGRPIPPKMRTWTQPIRPEVLQPTIQPKALPAAASTLEVREWQGTPIQRRATDNYVNATAMCQANGRRWAKYAESERCREYLQALAQRSEIRTFDLIEARPGRGGGTFVHPSLAIDLARWISPAFAVWMDGWFLESMGQPQPRPRPTLRKGVYVIADTRREAAELWWDALQRDVVGALSRRFNPTYRSDAGLPCAVAYNWQPSLF